MASRTSTPNPVNLLVLATLLEGPMHPYEIQRLSIERHKTSIQGVSRGSIYHAVQKLEARGLIRAVETHREGRRPERTVYRLTEEGREEVQTWLTGMLSQPRPEISPLVNALEFIAMLSPEEVTSALDHRLIQLDRELGGLRAAMVSLGGRLPRVLTIEAECIAAMMDAERSWVTGLLEELRSGEFTWSTEQLQEWARGSTLAGVYRPEQVPPEM